MGLSFADRLLLVVLALRTNLTERQLASLFAVSQAQVDRVVRDLTGALSCLLGATPKDRRGLRIVDGTLIPTRDYARSTKSKTTDAVPTSRLSVAGGIIGSSSLPGPATDTTQSSFEQQSPIASEIILV